MKIVNYSSGMHLIWNVCDIGEVDLCHHIANDCKTIFDVGTRDESHIVDNIYSASKRFYLFEPLPQFTSVLSERYKTHENVSVHQAGLGANETWLDFFESSQSFINREVFKQEKPTLRVPVTTVDKFCAQNNIEQIDFLKIDTEGFELEVLLGAKRMLGQKKIKFIQFEYSDTYLDAKLSLQQVVNSFSPDWNIFLLQPQMLVHIPREHMPSMERYLYNNFLATTEF